MNKVVRHHVRAGDLPADLRGDIPAEALVTVSVEEEGLRSLSAADLDARIDRLAGRLGSDVDRTDRILDEIAALKAERARRSGGWSAIIDFVTTAPNVHGDPGATIDAIRVFRDDE